MGAGLGDVITLMSWRCVVKGAGYLLWPRALTAMMDRAMPAEKQPHRKVVLAGAFITVVGHSRRARVLQGVAPLASLRG